MQQSRRLVVVRHAEAEQGAATGAEPETVLDLLREVPADAACVVVVGHNPTMAYLANLLDDGEGDEAAATELTTRGFPTCSLAVFAYEGAWADLDVTAATLQAFHV